MIAENVTVMLMKDTGDKRLPGRLVLKKGIKILQMPISTRSCELVEKAIEEWKEENWKENK